MNDGSERAPRQLRHSWRVCGFDADHTYGASLRNTRIHLFYISSVEF